MTARPLTTYRLQVRAAFDLDAAAAVTGYLRELGVSWAYLSPLLRATPGSDHGYDVVDPTLVDPERGGAEGLARFSDAARAAGLGILVDIVPNHMGISAPRENPWWWDVLRLGRDSAHADAFDIDWEYGGGRVCVPVLGASLDEVLAAGELVVDPTPAADAPSGVLRYFDHVFPLTPGSIDDGGPVAVSQDGTTAATATPWSDPEVVRAVLERQHYELRFWRDEAAELNYRRFFAVTTLAGVRVERPEVFEATHAEILRWLREGLADGLRVDHPDGLLDPGGYLEQLAGATGDAYVLVEKILEHGEALPAWWATDGTTGYDALAEYGRVLTDPVGEEGLNALDARLRTQTGLPAASAWHDLIHDTKRMIAETIQVAEIRRLIRGLPTPVGQGDRQRLQDALAELLACFPVYRSYLPAGREHLDAAAAEASGRRSDLAGEIAELVPVLADPSLEVARRFQQTTGPVMAKGVEDTAFYRYNRLGSLTEVGGDPSQFALPVAGFHAAQAARQSAWPHAMTTLSTHDTKRGEDVRARLTVLSEMPERWSRVLEEFRHVATTGHGPFDTLLWQAIVGAWPGLPLPDDFAARLHAYAEKAAREAAESTGWWDPVEPFESAMHAVVDAATGHAAELVDGFVREILAPGWVNGLSQKLLQLAGPGVPDVYQGSELWELSLVDPDNRRAVDFPARAAMLADLDAGFDRGELPDVDATGAAKLLLTSRTLRLRRDRPDLFTRYTPLTVVGEASAHAVAFDRGGAQAVATRLPLGLARRGGWGDTALLRRETPAVDVLTGRRYEGGVIPLADLLSTYPVALLVPEDAAVHTPREGGTR
ncbi:MULTISPECIES: malto-oligosyltrehalose synthase [Microbacterium]|uniref:Malto-oligosyltrehalose synthase n=1 Tax=Microbacterium wangchenii TaxID=2541726 RepID=A0ABX5SRX9_9MICO|nr:MULTISPECIES: malto-oligosyltrehalose synthase [Microbacterium]MCK6068358.1 malto-oligosyltrehalose synthase [Microbacterium sp. EYE_512]QBR87634.1 malto-oligosyltrehalose synthase [Microbacterium wangchenii]TXK15902.1 malto-oligosyltrehalose synthase [Microbacterium wangchenii]